MPVGERPPDSTPRLEPASVSWNAIGLVSVAFIIGIVAAWGFMTTAEGQTTTFAVAELIGFTLSVVLAGASIVLAVSAIHLGRASEDALIRRSDESIRMQNEVFVKTTEALQRIESSTGVTEKRIEDMIAGRVGDISHDVAQQASRKGLSSQKSVEGFEKTLRDSLLRNLRAWDDPKIELEIRKRREREAKEEHEYQAAHDNLLERIGSSPGVETEKAGHGTPGKEGADAIDAVFVIDERTVAVSTLRPHDHPRVAEQLITGWLRDIQETNIDMFFIVFFGRRVPDGRVKNVREYLEMVRPEFAEKIHLLPGSYKDLENLRSQVLEEV